MNATAQDIKDFLIADSSLGLVFGTDLFCFKQPDEPDQCVTLYDTGGFAPNPSYRYDRPTIQVRVRGDQNGYRAAYDLANDIKETLRAIHNETINSTRYIGIWIQSDIFSNGYDEKNRPELTFNVRIHRTTT